jgi:hypothetical protein
MKMERLREILDAYGADPRHWPQAERDAALSLIAGSKEAGALRNAALRLDALLDEAAPLMDLELDAAAIVARVTATSGNVHRLPVRQRGAGLSVGWPSFAGLAAAAAAGFVVGWLNLAAIAGVNGGAEVSDQSSGLVYTEVEPW